MYLRLLLAAGALALFLSSGAAGYIYTRSNGATADDLGVLPHSHAVAQSEEVAQEEEVYQGPYEVSIQRADGTSEAVSVPFKPERWDVIDGSVFVSGIRDGISRDFFALPVSLTDGDRILGVDPPVDAVPVTDELASATPTAIPYAGDGTSDDGSSTNTDFTSIADSSPEIGEHGPVPPEPSQDSVEEVE